MQRVIGLEPEVKQPLHVRLVGAAPGVVVGRGREGGAAEQWRDVVEDRPQHGVHGIGTTPDVIVVQFVYQLQKLCPVKPVRRMVCLDCGDHLAVDISSLRGLMLISAT